MITIKLEDGRKLKIDGNPSPEEIDSIVVEATGGAQTHPDNTHIKQPEAPRSYYGNRAITPLQGNSYNQLQNVSEGLASYARKGQMDYLIKQYLEEAQKLKDKGEPGTVRDIAYKLHQGDALGDAVTVATLPLGAGAATAKGAAGLIKLATAGGLQSGADEVLRQSQIETKDSGKVVDEFSKGAALSGIGGGLFGKAIEKLGTSKALKKAKEVAKLDEQGIADRYLPTGEDAQNVLVTVRAFRKAGYKDNVPLSVMVGNNETGKRLVDKLESRGTSSLINTVVGTPIERQKKVFVKFFDEKIAAPIKRQQAVAEAKARDQQSLANYAYYWGSKSADELQVKANNSKWKLAKGIKTVENIANSVSDASKGRMSKSDTGSNIATGLIDAATIATGKLPVTIGIKEVVAQVRGLSGKAKSDALSQLLENKLKGVESQLNEKQLAKVKMLRTMAAIGKLTPNAVSEVFAEN